MRTTFVLSLLASSVFAAPALPADSLLPSFEIVKSGATITPPSTTTTPLRTTSTPLNTSVAPGTSTPCTTTTTPPPPPPSSTPCTSELATALPSSDFDPPFSVSIPTEISSLIPTSTGKPTALLSDAYGPAYSASIPTEISSAVPTTSLGVDQPNPSGTFTLPASESFDSIKAPAFTLSLPIPIITYSPSSTPCSTEAVPTEAPSAPAETPDASEVPVPEAPAASTPCTETAAPTKTPDATTAPEAPAVSTPCTEETQTPDATTVPAKSKSEVHITLTQVVTVTPSAPAYGAGATETPCSEKPQTTATRAQAGVPALTPLASEAPLPTASSVPTGRPMYGGRPGFGWGRRPKWFGAGTHAAHQPSLAGGKAATTPCTLETRLKPAATGAAY